MCRDSLSATELMHQVIADLKPFTEVLLPKGRLILTQFTEYLLRNQAEMAIPSGPLPVETAYLVVLLEEHKRVQRIYNELNAEIERLKGVAQRLQEMPLIEDGCS